MAALSTDDVVLVARGNDHCMKLTLHNRIGNEVLALKVEFLSKCPLLRAVKWASRNVEVVLARELPVHLSAKGRVAAKAQVLLEINGTCIKRVRPLDVSRWARIKPCRLD